MSEHSTQKRAPEAVASSDLLRIVIAGSVDDGKSTLMGRLLYDTKAAYDDQLENVRRASGTVNGLELAFLTDGLRAEREQGITIDVAYRYFGTERRRFIIGDAPGHDQYTRNMATAASNAQLAVILIDARKGLLLQTRRHAYICSLMGIRHVVLAVNKMDLVGFEEAVFRQIESDFAGVAKAFGFANVTALPISALSGDNVVEVSPSMPWFRGRSLLEVLETIDIPVGVEQPLRFPVQTVLRNGDFRGYSGQIASGSIKTGDEVLALPARLPARIAAIVRPDVSDGIASAPLSVTIVLDRHIDLGRGDMLVDPANPPAVTRIFEANLVWMGEMPLLPEHPYLIRQTTRQVCGTVTRIGKVFDPDHMSEKSSDAISFNEIGSVTVETHQPLYCDPYEQNRTTGALMIIDPKTNRTVGAGVMSRVSFRAPEAIGSSGAGPDFIIQASAPVSSPLTVWFTGLSAAGKTTIAHTVYEKLWAKGLKVEMLDGDAMRKHLCKDLGFSKADREDNIRRLGFVAELLNRNGAIAIVAAISSYRAVREEVRHSIPNFIEVYVNAPLEVCEKRDPKGYYHRARAGEIKEFTGISDPYEPPLNPDVECRTDVETVAESVAKVIRVIESRLGNQR